MARNTMQRKVSSSVVSYSVVEVVDGQVQTSDVKTIEVAGRLSEQKAQRTVKNIEESSQVVITGIEHKEEMYTMTIEDFIKHATKEETTNGGNE